MTKKEEFENKECDIEHVLGNDIDMCYLKTKLPNSKDVELDLLQYVINVQQQQQKQQRKPISITINNSAADILRICNNNSYQNICYRKDEHLNSMPPASSSSSTCFWHPTAQNANKRVVNVDLKNIKIFNNSDSTLAEENSAMVTAAEIILECAAKKVSSDMFKRSTNSSNINKIERNEKQLDEGKKIIDSLEIKKCYDNYQENSTTTTIAQIETIKPKQQQQQHIIVPLYDNLKAITTTSFENHVTTTKKNYEKNSMENKNKYTNNNNNNNYKNNSNNKKICNQYEHMNSKSENCKSLSSLKSTTTTTSTTTITTTTTKTTNVNSDELVLAAAAINKMIKARITALSACAAASVMSLTNVTPPTLTSTIRQLSPEHLNEPYDLSMGTKFKEM